ncbi:MAG TPA: zinc-binding dehydrogenase [Candidatus Hydrogenedentes bacterium]|nr:zinc-binding dehydrogenase [Candidatus Hydrogenedentota bacterium]HPG65256.1 zinc-binding dehydrogenase [Candidatus Hydrogenedentota bacterium]
MKALQILAPGTFEVHDVPTPEPGPGEVLIKVLAVTTCPHWDMHILGGIPMFPGVEIRYPYTLGQPGHEACGDVAAVGAGVRSVAAGDRVCVWRDRGHDVQGCYAQYVVVDEPSVIPVPDALSPQACAPLELAMCVSAHVMYGERLDAFAGQRVGVFGLGPAGLVAVQLARAAGASEVLGFDPIAQRRQLALALGADRAIEPDSDEASDFPKRLRPGSIDTAIDCVGMPAVVHQAMTLTNHLVILFAVQRDPYVFHPEFWGGLTLAGTRRHTREAAEYAAEHLRDGRLDLGAIVTHTVPLGEYGKAVKLLKDHNAVKVAILPQE